MGKKPSGDSVFWPGDGKIYEMHWGDHNSWNVETIEWQQASVSKNTRIAATKKDDGDSVFWASNQTLYEQHWGTHNSWRAQTNVDYLESSQQFECQCRRFGCG